MIGPAEFGPLLSANPSIEAVIRLSRDGLPLSSRLRVDGEIDEVISIGAGLFSSAVELGLVSDAKKARLFIGAEHGSLFIRAEPEGTLLLVLTNDQCTERQVEAIIETYEKR